MPDVLLFAVLPYVVFVVFLIVTIQRYRQRKFTYSTLSSQFLENRLHFWGSVPFHYGILFVLLGHFGAFLMPKAILSWNAAPFRLFLLEVTGLVFALMALVGLGRIVLRRWNNPKAHRVTSATDWILYAILLVQVASGIWVAVSWRWGSSWFSAAIVPWLWSLVCLNPDVGYLTGLPVAVKVHAVNAF